MKKELNGSGVSSAVVPGMPEKPSLTVGVVTHDRSNAFAKCLEHLKASIIRYGSPVQLVVANNSGVTKRGLVKTSLGGTGIESVCDCDIVDSPINSISVGRNLILDNALHNVIVFLDDDEYPQDEWLLQLVSAHQEYGSPLIAGPIIPIYPGESSGWVKHVDLHNSGDLKSGDKIEYAASGNFLFDQTGAEDLRFNEAYGKSGGEDTDFFLRLRDLGFEIVWCKEAYVLEDIPVEKATSRYMIRRFMTQGENYRNIKEQRGEILSMSAFKLRAFILSVVSLSIGYLLIQISPSAAAKWLKRGYSNMGKYISSSSPLYE